VKEKGGPRGGSCLKKEKIGRRERNLPSEGEKKSGKGGQGREGGREKEG